MIGAIIVTHGALAEGLIDAAESIMGSIENVEYISILRGDSTDEIRQRLITAIDKVSLGNGVMIFTDMFGGTPTNISLSFLSEGEVEVFTGVNLPILLKFLSHQDDCSITDLVVMLKECGRESIVPASEMLKNIE